ncbi:dTDP-4-amino-4,6-dideoxygalactose transaminase [Paraburkholderia hospita]|uniref:dTDP-4-amino-4,6-dideoxygalactose transaminase n=1 Tax=Paraburkholderia hospita TaxID=169430 RepID=UPI000271827A|nr:dTDP-4-amino-4,6-dideoxygalactose transaminase [Paraburkholderia hospita]EUC14714.1 TDP-4-keto-6-deoxy-D-glucose transaminase [Burkholderia sp. BT03]SKC94032.1 dTDP-4-amino-4,6-dideoxygalactose transaminase [Paraburkholderia hospita]
MTNRKIAFNWPYMTGKEMQYIAQSHADGRLAGDGPFTKLCHQWIERSTGCCKALLTHSCTAALEMAAMLLDIRPGDEIIMPSYTFVSTANAFVLRGGVPVFVDIREDTLNIDERLIEAAITPRTRAIAVMHYAGVSCEMDTILQIARAHGLPVIEDAAQGVTATYKGRTLGAIGDIGAYSFHETKNVISGEGGALLVADPKMARRAEIIREKGTDRSRFFRGEVDKYTWQEVGSSFLPGELTAAFLWAQLEEADRITASRLEIWDRYHTQFAAFERDGLLRRPVVPAECGHNAHMYYILLPQHQKRQEVIDGLKAVGVSVVFHYVPLHTSPGGLKYGRPHGQLSVTDRQSQSLIRLPIWVGLTPSDQDYIVEHLGMLLRKN